MESLTKKTRLTTKEAAEYLGLSPYTLERWRMAGSPVQIPYLKFGKAVRYEVQALDQFMVASRQDG